MSDVIEASVMKHTLRSHQEIVERLKEIGPHDFFGFESSDLLVYLPWDKAKPFLKEDANESEWRTKYPVFTAPLKAALEYMPFAWEKANGCRGLSAMRSLDHCKAWLWMAGYGGTLIKDLFDDYDNYGKGQLVFVSELVGFNWRGVDNGEWVFSESDPGLSDASLRSEINKWVELANIHRKE